MESSPKLHENVRKKRCSYCTLEEEKKSLLTNKNGSEVFAFITLSVGSNQSQFIYNINLHVCMSGTIMGTKLY